MLKLLKRDLKLHWDVIVLPYVILLLVFGAIGYFNYHVGIAAAMPMGVIIIPFLPLSIHLKEIKQGTLPDLMTLPYSRTALVNLRYIEVLLFSLAMFSLAHLETWLAQSAAVHRFVHFDVLDRTGFALSVMPLLICFAYPMPFMLRWDGKGLFVAFATILWGFGPLIGYVLARFPFGNDKYTQALTQFVQYIKNHPGQATSGFIILFLILFSISYLLSLKAFSNRDF